MSSRKQGPEAPFRPSSALRTESISGCAVEIPRKEIFRYLGYRRIEPTQEIVGRVEACAAKLREQSSPRAAWQVFPLTVRPDPENVLETADLAIESRGLAGNCRGCDGMVLMAATIGPGCDFLIRRAEAVSMTDAAIYQAAGAAMVEAWCDEVNGRVRRAAGEIWQRRAHPRFSPGYGDLPLSLQRDFFRILQLPRTCGMSLGDSLLMSPSKSVTAFIGLDPSGVSGAERLPSGCEACGRSEDCEFTSEGDRHAT